MPLDPRITQEIMAAVDQRFEQLVARQPRTAYGVVDTVDTANHKCNVFVAGDAVPSAGFTYAPWLVPSVGNRVRVVIDPRGDRYVDEVFADSLVVSDTALLYGWQVLTSGVTIVTTGGVDADFSSGFRVTYPGNPEMAGRQVVIRAHAEVTGSVNVVGEINVSLFADVAPNNGPNPGTRLHFARDRVDTANTFNQANVERTAEWDAEQAVEFKVMVRTAASGTYAPYASVTADYVSHIGYEVVGYF